MQAVAAEAGIEEIAATYMTRAYATRHGAGPLPGEAALDWAEVVDLTNAPNDWQGAIRLAPLDAGLMVSTVKKDIALASSSPVGVRASLGVTCLDQLRGTARVLAGGGELQLRREALAGCLAEAAGLPVGLTAAGPTRRTVRFGDHFRRREVRAMPPLDAHAAREYHKVR